MLQVKYHEDFEKNKGSFTPVVTDPITERVKKNMQDFSDISYRGIQRRVVEMERKRVDQDQETLTGKQHPGFVTARACHLHKAQADPDESFYSSSAVAIQIYRDLEMMFIVKVHFENVPLAAVNRLWSASPSLPNFEI